MVTVHHEVIDDGLELPVNMRSSKRNKDTSSLTHMKGAVHALTFAIRNLGKQYGNSLCFHCEFVKKPEPKVQVRQAPKEVAFLGWHTNQSYLQDQHGTNRVSEKSLLPSILAQISYLSSFYQ